MKLQDIYLNLKNDLEKIEDRLSDSIFTNQVDLRASSVHLLRAGGKRMRPVFVLLAGHFGNYDLNKLQHVAVALELIHMASLVHDDVVDDAETRRGQKTVKSEWDNKVAMYTGDFIFARALQEVTQLEQPQVQQILSKAIWQMCLGEIQQIEDLYNGEQKIKKYLQRIKRKTALLMAVSCQLGALVAGANSDVVWKMYAYGYAVGMAFQMTDDVLDFIGDEKTLGKPAGSDLRQGNVTLPVIYALHSAPTEQKEKIFHYLESNGEAEDLEEVLSIVRNSGGIEYTLDFSKRYLDKALSILDTCPFSRERESLRLIADFIVNRSY